MKCPLVGAYNGENLLVAAGCAHALGVPPEALAAGAAGLRGVPGRLERVDGGGDRVVLVDYAHTPDALARALGVLRPLARGRLAVVFGCGGDRDRGKRPLMGRAAAAGADLVIVTSDNPRGEPPETIIGEIVPGLEAGGMSRVARPAAGGYTVEPDRRAAIRLAVAALRSGDALLIAGKGHEDYQITGAERRHFDDREEARAALAAA